MAFESLGIDSVLIVAVLAGAVAFFYSNLGLGGGQLYVPIMDLFFLSLAMREIVPLSLCFAFVTMLSATYTHSRKGLVHFKLGGLLAAGGLVGVVAGVLFTTTVSEWVVKLGFAALLVTAATKMMYDLRRAKKDYVGCPVSWSLRCRLAGVGVSVLTGFLIGSFGIGGGVVSVPLIIYVFRFEPRFAIGTSALMGAILTPAAFVAYALTEGVTIHYDLALALTPIVFVMGFMGSTWGLKKLKTKVVKMIFTCGVYLAASEMIMSILLD
ncbi:MAG: sulfite exporter TauE/SafE family protein [Thermoplasmata archaeon]